MALIHEVGHALWLEHPFEGATPMPVAYDTNQYTVMSYTSHPHNLFTRYHPAILQPDGSWTVTWDVVPVSPSTAMLLDIAAIQRMYGANLSWHTGDDVYEFDPADPFIMTLWDAGGVDSILASNFETDCLIDLREGHFSSLRILPDLSVIGLADPPLAPPKPDDYDGTDNLAIAWGAVIENAVGGAGNDILIGNPANNLLEGMAGNDTLDGGSGVDTAVFRAPTANYLIAYNRGMDEATVTDRRAGGDGTDSLAGIERLQFTDAHLAFDLDGNAGQVYRLYKAAFARTPDLAGLGGWIAGMDTGGLGLEQVANSFIASAEFQSLYGANSSNGQFVTALYLNVMGRAPDAGGYGYWVDQLASSLQTRAQVLVTFSESAENKAAVAP